MADTDNLVSPQWAAYCEKERMLISDWGTEREAKHEAYLHQSQPGYGNHKVTYRKRELAPVTFMKSTSFNLIATTAEQPRQFYVRVLKKRR